MNVTLYPDVLPPDTTAQPLTMAGPAGRHRAPDPGQDAATDGGEEFIVGIAAAARYLGYDKPDSFRRARTRHPILGEGRTEDGRPSWTPHVLRSWQSKRKIVGNRNHHGEHD